MYTEDNIEVPESALLQVERVNRFGSVPGLADEDLMSPDELERQVIREEFAPVLALPVERKHSGIRPAVDESGVVDWGAFGTADFDRLRPGFDKVRYKAERLREQLKDVLIMLSIVKERLPGRARYLVLNYLRRGIIELDHIVSHDMRAVARHYLRAKRLRAEIARLRKVSRQREEARIKAWVE